MEKKASYAILGYPLGHTLSPPIHKRLFSLSKTEADYSVMEVAPKDLEAAMPRLRALSGFNITIPYKQVIIPFLDKLDSSAERYGAVNCVKNVDGVLIGYNTDCYGFTRSLLSEDVRLDQKVLLLGCGGAGRMMATEVALAGGTLTIASREPLTEETVLADIRKLLPEFTAKIISFPDISGHFDLLINATPVGMFPNVDELPVPAEIIACCNTVFDAIYNPRITKLLEAAIALGKKAVPGMGMLVWQAVVAHEIWDKAHYEDFDVNALIAEMEGLV